MVKFSGARFFMQLLASNSIALGPKLSVEKEAYQISTPQKNVWEALARIGAAAEAHAWNGSGGPCPPLPRDPAPIIRPGSANTPPDFPTRFRATRAPCPPLTPLRVDTVPRPTLPP